MEVNIDETKRRLEESIRKSLREFVSLSTEDVYSKCKGLVEEMVSKQENVTIANIEQDEINSSILNVTLTGPKEVIMKLEGYEPQVQLNFTLDKKGDMKDIKCRNIWVRGDEVIYD